MYKADEERERQRREMGREDDFLFCCFHEAGHAIVAEAVAPGSVQSLRVWAAGNGFAGELLHEAIDKSKRASALIAVAGEVAERLFSSGNEDWRRREYEQGNRPSSEHGVWIRRSDGDEANLNAYLDRSGWRHHETRKSETHQLQREARAILTQNWDAFARLGEAVIAARVGQGGASLQRAAIIAAMEGRPPTATRAAEPAKRAAPATSGREMTVQELIEFRDQAKREGHDYLYRLLDRHIGWKQGASRGKGGPMETAALGSPARRGGR